MLSQSRTARKIASNSLEEERVGHGDEADDHGTHVAENGSKNQSLEGGMCAHSSRLPAAAPPAPDLLLLSFKSEPEKTGGTPALANRSIKILRRK
jgi:hypothetical protein